MRNFTLVLTFLFLLVFSVNKTNAMPAYPFPIKFTQPDGTSLTITLRGDEFFHWAVTDEGYTVLQNSKGAYEYATTEKSGKLILSGIVAHSTAKRGFEENSFLTTIPKGLSFADDQLTDLKSKSPIQRKFGQKMGGFPSTGTRKLLMILANFSNTSTSYTQANFDNYMNGTTGSFKTFYTQNSYGLLTVNTTVTAWVKVPNTHDYYGPEAKWTEFIRDAVNAADAAGVDFSQFDNDGDGKVDGIAVIHQGQGQEETSNTSDIWSHSYNLSYEFNVVKDGVTIDAYTTQPEKSSTGMAGIGVMCHEFGHNMGAPDFYDTNYGTNGSYDGTGSWDLMAGGSWNGSNPSGSSPAFHNSWTKIFFGWTTATVISSAANITMQPSETSNVVYRINTNTSNEYFLLENRQAVSFDAALPGHGMIIYHVDGTFINSRISNNTINIDSHQGLHPEAAGGSINNASCAWPGTGAKTQFTDATTPNMKSWAGVNTAKPITAIVESNQVISFAFMGGVQNPVAPTATTLAATNLTSTGATMNGSVAAGNATTTITFEYGLTTAYGSTINATPNTLTGNSATSVSANLTGLTAGTTYHFRVKAVNSVNTTYGSDLTFTTPVGCATITSLPFTQTFDGTTLPNCWENILRSGTAGQIWKFGTFTSGMTTTGNYAYLNSDAYGSGNSQNADLITPNFDFTAYSQVTLAFKHYFKSYTGSSASLAYSIDGGSTWTNITTITATTSNPATFSQDLSTQVAGKSNVKFKWNYTGTWGYYWCIDDVNITGTSGTSSAPTATTNAATSMANTGATLNGTVTANNASTTVTFEYGTTTSYGSTVNATPATVTGTTATNVTAAITGLTANTLYHYRVKAVNAKGTTYGADQTFTTTANPITYCTVKGNNVSYEWIKYVALNGMTNSTGANAGYAYFSAKNVNLKPGNTYTITFAAGFPGTTAYTEYWKIWIDYNQNGTFDSNELIVSGSTTTANNYTATFTVPTTAVLGASRLRVLMSYSSSTTSACGTFSYGEVEDYPVTFSTTATAPAFAEAGDKLGNENIEEFMVYPNPAKNYIDITLGSNAENQIVEFFSMNGKSVKKVILNERKANINISDLAPGMYIINVNDGRKISSQKIMKY